MQVSPAESSQVDMKPNESIEFQVTSIPMDHEPMVKKTVPITLSWENINVFNPSSKDSLSGRIMFCKKEVPSKQIIKDGKFWKNCGRAYGI